MSADDPLLRAYANELAYLRTEGEMFARSHPKLARRLEWSRDGSSDPHVQRLIESFAFLTARIQRDIDADFPLIPAALLGVLYPHLTAPVPSMAIARFTVNPAHSRAAMGVVVPRGTQLFAAAENGPTCRFRTAYPVTLWPIEVAGIDMPPPFALPGIDAASVLRVRLACQGSRTFAEMKPGRLRFFIDADPATAEALYELLTHRLASVVLMEPDGERPLRHDGMTVRPVGFARDEAVLPHPDNAHQGYRLLHEYFAFPEKYLFLDVDGLPPLGEGRRIDLLFLLNERAPAGLVIDDGTLRLGCTPMANLFPKTSEPIRIDHTRVEYRLVPDLRWEHSTEIHTVLRVAETASEDEARTIRPFFSVSHPGASDDRECFWMARRQPTGRPELPGTDILLSFKDLGLDPALPSSPVVFAHTLCTNRGVAEGMPAGTRLEMELPSPTAAISCLTRPTAQIAPPEDGRTLWRLVSHLSLNHLSLSGGEDGLRALQEILRLYGGRESRAGQRVIDRMEGLTARTAIRRMGIDAWRGFCRGTELTLAVDDRQGGSGLFLFTAVLSRFLALYSGINHFTQLAVHSRRREGNWITWPPLSGETPVL